MQADSIYHMLIGPPGSGKSTLATFMQREISRSCIVSTDHVRQKLYGDEAHQGNWLEVHAGVLRLIRQAQDRGAPVIYDATNARRSWRMSILKDVEELNLTWVGWHLTTDLQTCFLWNAQRERSVPAQVIEQSSQDLKQFPPHVAEGFAAIFSLDPTQPSSALRQSLLSRLDTLDRSIVNRANRTRHADVRWHRYSALLDFDRLMHLIALLIKEPGVGGFHRDNPDYLKQLIGDTASSIDHAIHEISAIMASRYGRIYADAEALAQDLRWLEQNELLSAAPSAVALQRPDYATPPDTPHAYSDWDAFQRLITIVRFIAHHPFYWEAEQGGSVDSLVSALQRQELLHGDRHAAIRKDIERVLKPFGILPPFRMRRGYFLGTGVLSQRQLMQIAKVLQSQAKTIQDPIALTVLDTLQERLQRSQHDLTQMYPVRVIGNRSIINSQHLPTSAIARSTEQLEEEIEAGQLLELKRFAEVGRFDSSPDKFFRAWPLQIVFHNIAWYLGYEIEGGPEPGLLQFERLDRLFRGRKLSQNRKKSLQRRSLERLQKLYRASGGLFLGSSATNQQQFLSRDESVQILASMTLELWFTDELFRFVSEGTQRFPAEQMKMSPRLGRQTSRADSVFCLSTSGDPVFPNRFQVVLPCWAIRDLDLRRWILGFGGGVKVIAPPEMALHIENVALQIAALYSKP